jgi:O-antigen/teichoic acid export membrane protein
LRNIKRIAKNSLFQALAYAAKALSTFVVYVVLARMNGAELLGNFAVVITLMGLFSFIASFGLPAFLTRELARNREDVSHNKQLIGASLTLVVSLSLAAIILLMLVGLLLHYSAAMLNSLILAGFGLAFMSLTEVIGSSFRSIEKMEWSEVPNIIMEVTFVLVTLIFALQQLTLEWVMIAYLFSRLIAFGAAVWFYQHHYGGLQFIICKELWKKLLKYDFPFSMNDALALVYVRVDVFMLSFFVSGAVVGIYEAATSLTIRVNLLARILNLSMYPFLSLQYTKNTQSIYAYTARSIHFLLIPGLLITIILWVFAREILLILYGANFVEAVTALRYMALIIPLRLVDNSLAVTLTAMNKQGNRTIAVAIAAATNVILNILIIPAYGMMGAVLSTIITEIVLSALFALYLRHELRDILHWRSFLAPGFGSLIVFAITSIHNMNIWLLGVFAILVYGVVILLIDRSSVEFLQIILPKAARKNLL